MVNTTTYLSGGRIQGRSDDSEADVSGYKLLARSTALGSAAGTITASGFTAKDNIIILGDISMDGSGYGTVKMTFNGDSSGSNGNYAWRQSDNFGTESGTGEIETDYDYIDVGKVLALDNFVVAGIRNTAAEEKLVNMRVVELGAAGAGTKPDHTENVSKWVNTSNQITTITLTCSSNFEAGSEFVVLGCDDDEGAAAGTGSGSNFWTELLNFTGTLNSGSAHTATPDTGSFTAKKFLMVDILTVTGNDRAGFGLFANGTSSSLDNNTDAWAQSTATNHATSSSGGVSGDYINLNNTIEGSDASAYTKMFILNRSDKEKLIVWHSFDSLGVYKEGYGKYSLGGGMGAGQITRFGCVYTTGQTYLKHCHVWGSD